GLPTYYTEEKLRDHFAKKGNVTDVKLKRKSSGESRRFAFIGYKDVKDAENAVKFFNGSFIDTSKISVELAKSFSDPNVPISWKDKRKERDELLKRTEIKLKQMEDAAARRKSKKQKNSKTTSLSDKIENNPNLKEFVEAMKPATQSKSWANDEVVNMDGAPTNDKLEEALGLKKTESSNNNKTISKPEIATYKGDESDEEYDDFNSNNNNNNNNVDNDGDEEMIPLTKQDDSNNNNNDDDEKMIPLTEIKDNENNESDSNKKENMDDLEWFKSKRKRIIDTKENDVVENIDNKSSEIVEESSEVDEKNANNEDSKDIEPQDQDQEPPRELSIEEKNIDKILITGRLFLRNILYSSKEEEFTDLFQPFGALKEVHIAVDSRTGKSKGFAYIQYENPKDAVKAYIELDKQIFQGRLLHILPGQVKKEHKLDEFELKNMPLKKQKLLKKKFEASKQEFSWNSLYMNSDAVLESVASQLGISKNELIDPTNSSSAVKHALAEAHVIGDVRSYFEKKGVDLTKFSERERDDKVILVKNFQYGTTREEIGELFAAYGELDRILMPPAGTIAIVEFRDLPAARVAFNKLSFRRLGKSILYLEKGPKNLFTKPADQSDKIKIEIDEKGKEIKATANDILGSSKDTGTKDDENNNDDNDDDDDDDDDDETEDNGPTVSIFVKNLNFSTTPSGLSDIFKPYPGFLLAIIKTKPDPKNTGKTQSMGFGFAEFKTKEQAMAALRSLDGYTLDGHKLQLKISTRVGNSNESSTKNKKAKNGKIIVKNLPFEATRKDVFELFNSFGSLKSVRVPKKFDKSARGFAFVEFATAKEANNAMDQLQGVHLLGRRLVLDYAEQETDDVEAEIEKMTKKTKSQAKTRELADLREGNSGKRKLDLEEEDEY
ncbi:Multiple RNA-binding domain-containing protein 1, partial [Pichia californica]